MRMTSREVTDFDEIVDILERCSVIRIAFKGDDYPYVVPVSFGIKRDGDNITLYFHGAKEGMKVEQIIKDPKVCIEADIFYKAEETSYGITAKYESVMGLGEIEEVAEGEAVEALRTICAHYDFADYSIDKCLTLPMTRAYKIKVHDLTGKRKLPNAG